MKNFKQILKGVTTAVGCSCLAFNCAAFAADVNFRPSKLEAVFYEIGFRNSSSGKFVSVFANSSGVTIDLATEGGLNTLSSGLSLNDSGTFDQMYVLLSNTVSVAGEPVTGCYIKSGDFSYNDGDFNIGTTNSALAGTANLTETGFGMQDANMDVLNSYKTTPAVTTSLNGTATSNLDLYLVNKDTKTPGLGGTINGLLFLGDLANSINLDSSKEGTLWVEVDSSEAMQADNASEGAECDNMNWQNTKFGLSVEQ